ncbi:MAG: glutathione S-transferase [Ponticaulis sp.]|nr:glutathione S-transferase [Ponticaulis sp.]|tara:strand:- start:747 stop:1949 length:1203 start_codon:yes stop_codon:yes gene_type:complete
MSAKYRLFGSDLSPYSVKVRSYLRYKKLPFDWVSKGFGTEKEFQGLAKSQALPMLVSPNGGIAHDSSLILSRIEDKVKSPAARPDYPPSQALSLLLEDYADEWLNKVMFHYRWGTTAAAKASATRQADQIFAGYDVQNRADIEKSIAKSMTGRLKLVGSSKKTAPILEASFERFLKLLNAHLEHHLFIFGGHPSFADFALAGQLSQLLLEEKPGQMIRDTAPFVSAWVEFMEEPRAGAPFDEFANVSDTLLPLIRDEVGATYVAWTEANAESIAKKRKTVTVKIGEDEFKQGVQGHSNASLDTLKAAFAATPGDEAIVEFLAAAGLTDTFPLGEPTPEPEAVPEAKEDATVADETTEVTPVEETAQASESVPETAVIPDEPDAPSDDAEADSEDNSKTDA